MAIEVILYKFSKKANSTEQPTLSTQQQTYQCLIKGSSGIINPAIMLDLGANDLPFIPNYAYIINFERFYFIREMTFDKGQWTFEMEVDTLASFKNQIGEQTCYILRSATSYDGSIVDSTYPTLVDVDIKRDSDALLKWETSSYFAGTFVVGIVGQSTTYYLMTKSNLDDFLSYIMGTDYTDDLLNNFALVYPDLQFQTNPLQFISTIKWLPFQVGSSNPLTVKVGYVDVDIQGQAIPADAVETVTGVFTLQNHPQITRGKFLNASPYTRTTLFYPPFGMIELDSTLLSNITDIATTVDVDLRTGLATLRVREVGVGELPLLSIINGQVGIDYQVSQVLNRGYGLGDAIEASAKTASSVASVFFGNVGGIGQAISDVNNGIKDALASKIPSATTIGGTGSINSLIGTPTLQQEFSLIAEEDFVNRGRPLCERRQINTLSGFIMVSDADISIDSTLLEQETIRNHMRGGFFYE